MMKTGSVPIGSQYAAIASSRSRKSARISADSSAVQRAGRPARASPGSAAAG